MKLTLIICMLFGYVAYSKAQTASNAKAPDKQHANLSKSFEDFVNENALTLITVGQKEIPPVKGEVEKQPHLLLSEYKLQVLDEEAQYYTVKGETQILKVTSMHRLKLMFESQKNIKSYE